MLGLEHFIMDLSNLKKTKSSTVKRKKLLSSGSYLNKCISVYKVQSGNEWPALNIPECSYNFPTDFPPRDGVIVWDS